MAAIYFNENNNYEEDSELGRWEIIHPEDSRIEESIQTNQSKPTKLLKPSDIYNNPSYFGRTQSLEELSKFDYIITHTWDTLNDNWFGAISAWYDAFELWYITNLNILPPDLNGPKIALLYPDCPSKAEIEKILLAIVSKYKIPDKLITRLCQSIFFIHKPKELILSKGTLPYENYSPKNLIFVDGKIPNIEIKVDNLYLSIIDSLKEEDLKRTDYNFLFIYRDKRIFDLSKDKKTFPYVRSLEIARDKLPNTLLFDDIRRINFDIFIKPNTYIEEDSLNKALEIEPKKKILLYLTERNKRHQILEDSNSWTNKELDDILNSIPKNLWNELALKIKDKQKELYNWYIDSKKRYNQKLSFTEEEKIALKNKGTIFGNGYTEDDVIKETIKVHLIIVGLTDSNRDFETALYKRALERGIAISTEVYLQKELPIIDIHSKYDIYLFTPMFKWSTSRFIPEALYHKKKLIFTEEAKKTLRWNIPLNLRYNDSEQYLKFLSEDHLFNYPKSILGKHIIGDWSE